jgi:hypothetical protein
MACWLSARGLLIERDTHSQCFSHSRLIALVLGKFSLSLSFWNNVLCVSFRQIFIVQPQMSDMPLGDMWSSTHAFTLELLFQRNERRNPERNDFVFNRRKNVFKSKVFGLVLEGPVNCRTTFHSTAFFVWLFWLFRFPLWRSFPSSIGIIPFSNGQTKSQNEKPSRSKP